MSGDCRKTLACNVSVRDRRKKCLLVGVGQLLLYDIGSRRRPTYRNVSLRVTVLTNGEST